MASTDPRSILSKFIKPIVAVADSAAGAVAGTVGGGLMGAGGGLSTGIGSGLSGLSTGKFKVERNPEGGSSGATLNEGKKKKDLDKRKPKPLATDESDNKSDSAQRSDKEEFNGGKDGDEQQTDRKGTVPPDEKSPEEEVDKDKEDENNSEDAKDDEAQSDNEPFAPFAPDS